MERKRWCNYAMGDVGAPYPQIGQILAAHAGQSPEFI